jgi:4-hydroxybenzoate polyprenyltransferase
MNYSSSQARLARLINLPLSRCIIDHLVDATIDVVNYGLGHRPSPRGRLSDRSNIKFRHFVHSVICRAQCTVPTLLTASIYIARAKPYITIAKPEWAFERVFLGALICATKVFICVSLLVERRD